jgi:protoporphyrinogen oxidase
MSVRFDTYDYCIIGSGAAGLTLAYMLLKEKKRVLMIERDARAGGLAKSHNHQGHVFDTGPKRFHTDDPIVKDFIHDVMSNAISLDTIGRSTLVHFAERYFNWPLTTGDLFKLPLGISVRAAFDLVTKKPNPLPHSFHQFISSKYGETLFRIFFKPYTEKFLRWEVEDIHSDWASTGINRTVIDKEVKAESLIDLLRLLTLPKKTDTKFLYPTHNGFGSFFERLFALCEANDTFDVLLSDTITRLEDRGDTFEAQSKSGSRLVFENLVWSGNLKDLCRLISPEQYNLHYINTVFFNLVCREEAVARHRAQWIYVSRGDYLVSRITCMREFSRNTCPDGYYNFICEVTDSQRLPQYFKQPESHIDQVFNEIVRMGFLKSRGGIEAVHINPVLDTYPIYHQSYKRDFGAAVRAVKHFSKRIHLIGRCGAYWYNNSDHSIRMALDMAEKLLRDPEREFDFRTYFGGVLKEGVVQH